MKTIFKPIKLDEQSHNVTFLHQALAALKLPVDDNEVSQGIAGADTLKKSLLLMEQLKVSVNTNATELDENITLAMAKAMADRGLVSASRSFSVSGAIKKANGLPAKHQRLIVLDLDLLGIAVYRSLRNLEDITRNLKGGFEYLGETASDSKGNYSITFYDWQYKRAERKMADVLIFSLDKNEIIAYSRIVNTEDYSDKGFVRDLDIILPGEDKCTEYQMLVEPLNIFLKQSGFSFAEVAKSDDQLAFITRELDLDRSKLDIAALAELLVQERPKLSHELFYGIGRQHISLNWSVLYKRQQKALQAAITRSTDEGIIRKFDDYQITQFLAEIQMSAVSHMLDVKDEDDHNALTDVLSNALPEEPQRVAFLTALRDFKGSNFSKFWEEHLPKQPEFKAKPELIPAIQLTQQLTALSGNHQPLVKILQREKGIKSAQALIEFTNDDWLDVAKKAKAPDFIEGEDDDEKEKNYAESLINKINATFPTLRIAKMVREDSLGIKRINIKNSIGNFFANNPKFSIAHSRVHDFQKEIEAASTDDNTEEVNAELMKFQRLFQVSITPEMMRLLLKNNFYSAYSIASIPRKNFINIYGKALGGTKTAAIVHQKAAFITDRNESIAGDLRQFSQTDIPTLAMSSSDIAETETIFKKALPNYQNLFGSLNLCECQHCRSVYSPAAYFVELLQFLEKSKIKDGSGDISAYDYLVGNKDVDPVIPGRRPDLAELALSCENTNTLIPYIDLANEVMEFYVVNDSLDEFPGANTGEATAAELRANPQYTNLDAYEILKDATFPFSLPFHQPLAVIRTYSDFLNVSRYEVMQAVNPRSDEMPDQSVHNAISAEAFGFSQEEYRLLTGEFFVEPESPLPAIEPHEYFGYDTDEKFVPLRDISPVQLFMERTGIAYTDLVELVKTQYINPHQNTLDYLQKIVTYVSSEHGMSPDSVYKQLKEIHDNQPVDLVNEENIKAAIDALEIADTDFINWIAENFNNFQQVITLFEPESKCNLETTRLRTIAKIYENPDELNENGEWDLGESGIEPDRWVRFHDFIRLWRKIGWGIHETDLMLHALGENNIRPDTIEKLESVLLLQKATQLPLNQLAVLWGHIDTYGKQSLYKKLFLNKAVQQIDPAFIADAEGNYLQDVDKKLADHSSAILAAFRISEEELDVIKDQINTDKSLNPLIEDFDTATLNLHSLSAVYRYVVLAKAIKLDVIDVCKLIGLFNATPFGSSGETYKFYTLAASVKTEEFKPAVLEYIFTGALPVDSKLGLDANKVRQTAKAIRNDLQVIEQNHLEITQPAFTLDGLDELAAKLSLKPEILIAKLTLTYRLEIVSRFMEIIDSTAVFDVVTKTNLGIAEAINTSDVLGEKFNYIEGSGRLSCVGVMSDDEQNELKLIEPTGNSEFKDSIDQLYAAPEVFINDNFDGFLSFKTVSEAIAAAEDVDAARATAQAKTMAILLHHQTTDAEASFDAKLAYIYQNFLPLLKKQLQQEIIASHLADLIGLSGAATALLIVDDVDMFIRKLSKQGFTASYFIGIAWPQPALETQVDDTINFSWGLSAPFDGMPASKFSVRWEGYIAPPTSDTYTLLVNVAEQDEVFNLYLDGVAILEKEKTNANTSFEIEVELDSAQLHLLTLEYAEEESNAGIQLRWKTAISAPEIIPSSVAYPADILNYFLQQVSNLYRAANFISGFKISEAELKHFTTYSADFSDINFKAIIPAHWIRIRDYVRLRNTVPQAQALLIDVFSITKQPIPLPQDEQFVQKDHLDELINKINEATAWNKTNIRALITYFFPDAFDASDTSVPPKIINLSLIIDGFKNDITLNRFYRVMGIVTKTGLNVETITHWGAVETDFDALRKTAQTLKNTVRAKYDDTEWLKVAADLNDKIRTQQQQALISYLLVQDSIKDNENAQIIDADSLFEYFLIDVQMGACMNTSRIVQANAAIQLFVNRILLNLEKNIQPNVIDTNRWEWMKNYRVWEANRKVFLWPECWLAPEWRNDRSEFFKELESHLLQNDITERSVEQGLRNYLMSMNKVANLDVCGMHRENYVGGIKDGNLKFLHVFGCTHHQPYEYFYRRWNEYQKWSAWEKVQVDIRSVEDGENSGVHLIPVVWKGRLFLFWPEFMEIPKDSGNNKQDMHERANIPIGEQRAEKHWEIRLAWSEYVDGTWDPKQVTKEYISTSSEFYRNLDLFGGSLIPELFENAKNLRPYQFRFVPEIVSRNALKFTVYAGSYGPSTFYFYDIQSAPNPDSTLLSFAVPNLKYENKFSKLSRSARLEFSENNYLDSSRRHELVAINTEPNMPPSIKLDIKLKNPFFYSSGHHTYFARPNGFSTHWIGEEGLNPHDFVNTAFFRTHSSELADSTSGQGTPFSSDMAFGGVSYYLGKIAKTTNLEFHTFYHPFSSKFVTRLNQGGIEALMGCDTEDFDKDKDGFEISDPIEGDKGDTFEGYQPTDLVVPQVEDLTEKRTYYQENVCFDALGANSLYNWELFFHAPLYIATRLSKNGEHEKAMKWFHYIFNPTTNQEAQSSEDTTARYWKVRPFKTTQRESLEELFRALNRETNPGSDDFNNNSTYAKNVEEWRKNPFDPHLVASNRPIAYMKHVVIEYVMNLINWGDSLFRQFTRESVYEAIQLYVIASHILGKRPEFVPKRGEIKTETYANLRDKLDAFGNALVDLENIFPYTSTIDSDSISGNWLGIGSALYFCIPANDKLLEYWDTVADRLFKIRHCQDIDGVERNLALFAPAIDPAALIQARSQGLSLGSILADLNSPPPVYRFAYLIQKANEFCNDVKALGSAVLAALEKKDGEELSRLRASQETNMLERVTGIRERQVLAAKVNKENLLKVRETAKLRLKHYKELLGDDSDDPLDPPSLDTTLTADGPLPVDTSISLIETKVDMSLVDSEESGVKLIPKEANAIAMQLRSIQNNKSAASAQAIATLVSYYPNISTNAQPMGAGLSATFGSSNIVSAINGFAQLSQNQSSINSIQGSIASTFSGHIRRTHDWVLQANLVIREIISLDKQITSADIQIQVAEKELQNHQQQIENSKQVELFLKDKFTNQELYQWMKEQLFSVYKQSYNLAYDMAKKAEKAYQYELGTETTNFIQYGYWDNSKQGLVAGEKLQLALRQLDKSYLEDNRRELELTKNISLILLNPVALIELQETGKCVVSLPEELFDLDFQGHYFRRIKSVSISIPCVAGPYTTVNCTLRLIKNTMRINTLQKTEGNGDDYEHHIDEAGQWLDDPRFRSNNVPVTSIATSTGQNDAGMFEFNFRDERYLPFERAGAISDWMIELSTEKSKLLRQFDYYTISDVIFHLKYTAREGSGPFKEMAEKHATSFIKKVAEHADQPLLRMFNMKHEFPTEWHKFLHPESEGTEHALSFTIGKEKFPFFVQNSKVVVGKIDVFAKHTLEVEKTYKMVLSYTKHDGNTFSSPEPSENDVITLVRSGRFGELNTATINVSENEEPDINRNITIRGFQNLATNPDEIEDMFVVFHYRLGV